MSDHSKALVPIEAWSYSSPDLKIKGYDVDIGLLAESLIYYDTVYINISNQLQFATILDWFIRQNRFDLFLSMVSQGIIQIYDFCFATAAIRIEESSKFKLMNIQDENQKKLNSFEQRYLYHRSVQSILPRKIKRKQFYSAFRGKVIEGKANDFSIAIDNAINDHADPRRLSLILQAFVDELYRIKHLGQPPIIKTNVVESSDKSERQITWNVNIAELSRLAGSHLNIGIETPLTAGGISNRLLWAAAGLNCDLYLSRPMGALVGDKLFEAERKVIKKSIIIESLEKTIEFPDVRNLVNSSKMNIDDVLLIRKNAEQFRNWINIEGERDRDAIIAYHNEVAKKSGFTKAGKKLFQVFGLLSGAALGSIVDEKTTGVSGAIIGASVSTGVSFLFDLISKVQEDWKPVIFGNWMKDRIEKLLDELN